MLFNSPEFLFLFLPITAIGFQLAGLAGRNSAIRWLILMSFLFYAWWRPINVLIILPSIIINFTLAKALLHIKETDGSERLSKIILTVGVVFNLAFLGVFKYTDFLFGTI